MRSLLFAAPKIQTPTPCPIDTNDVIVADEQNTLTQDEQERILEATREAGVRNWDLTTGNKFYLCDTMRETAFNKTSRRGLRNFRYFDLEEILGNKVPHDVGALAESLRQHTWE